MRERWSKSPEKQLLHSLPFQTEAKCWMHSEITKKDSRHLASGCQKNLSLLLTTVNEKGYKAGPEEAVTFPLLFSSNSPLVRHSIKISSSVSIPAVSQVLYSWPRRLLEPRRAKKKYWIWLIILASPMDPQLKAMLGLLKASIFQRKNYLKGLKVFRHTFRRIGAHVNVIRLLHCWLFEIQSKALPGIKV